MIYDFIMTVLDYSLIVLMFEEHLKFFSHIKKMMVSVRITAGNSSFLFFKRFKLETKFNT